jgi:hypothetical protein
MELSQENPMQSPIARLRGATRELWRTNAPLTFVGLLMIPVLLGTALGLWLDPRTITGAPAWLKPAKFAVSIGIYSLTVAWAFSYLPRSIKTRRIIGWATAAALLLEIVIISLQAARGRPSHFNVSTPLDAVLFRVMGAAIVLQTLSSIAVAVALFRERFTDRALGWAFRLGLIITLIGASTGGIMPAPTPEQLADAASGQMTLAGAHTVGAPDGGPGLVGTGWSREHGDLRVPHFFGLHALQVLPFLSLAFRRTRWSETKRARLIQTAAGSYAALFAILLWQALRGESVVAPGAVTLAVLAAWALSTVSAAWLVEGRKDERESIETATSPRLAEGIRP